MFKKLSNYLDLSAKSIFLISFLIIGMKQSVAVELINPDGVSVHSPSPTPAKPNFVLEQFYRGTDSALKEFGSARSDHAAIALDIGQCYYEKIGDPIHWSPTTRAILLFELDEHLMHSLYYPDGASGDKTAAQGLLVLNPFHAAAISFSDRISRDRLEVRRELEDNRSRSRSYQILILIFGACATIFVSIRSIMQGNTQTSALVGVLAIVFSAAGAAVSSMSAFDGSQAVALRDQRTLSQLQQLHWRVASDVLTRPELCKEDVTLSADAREMVGAWRSRLEAVLDNAVESVSRPGDLSPGKPVVVPPVEKNGRTASASAVNR